MTESIQSTEPPIYRLLHVRLPAETHEAVRHLAISKRCSNATIITWAVETLQRHVRDGGAR